MRGARPQGLAVVGDAGETLFYHGVQDSEVGEGDDQEDTGTQRPSHGQT